jgi:hypothetical protein
MIINYFGRIGRIYGELAPIPKLRRRTPQQSWRGMQGAAATLFEFEQIQLSISLVNFIIPIKMFLHTSSSIDYSEYYIRTQA